MTVQQRDMIDQILRGAQFDLGGDVAAQHAPSSTQMLRLAASPSTSA